MAYVIAQFLCNVPSAGGCPSSTEGDAQYQIDADACINCQHAQVCS